MLALKNNGITANATSGMATTVPMIAKILVRFVMCTPALT
jgi:hypothetical protein